MPTMPVNDARPTSPTAVPSAAVGSPTFPQKTHAAWRLVREVIASSKADDWDGAKKEWALEDVWLLNEPGRCVCGHSPILEACLIQNRLNGSRLVVGNQCVSQFMNLPSAGLFASLRRVVKDVNKPLSASVIQHAHRKGWINDWAMGFYLDTASKKRLTAGQRAKRVEINRQVLRGMSRAQRLLVA